MDEEHINALLLVIHGDIFLDYDKAIDIYASKYPRTMLLIYPLSEAEKKQSSFRKLVGWKLFNHSPACIVEYVSEYIFLISKKTNKKTNKQEKHKTKQSETRR